MLLSYVVGGMAQKSNFKSALKDGRTFGKPYVLKNPKAKWLDYNKVEQYANEKDYILGSHSSTSYNRFGELDYTVVSAEFLPKSELKDYIFEILSNEASLNLGQLTKNGSGFYYYHDDYFKRCDNIQWNGDIVNGMLNGTGTGLAVIRDKYYIYFKGTFEKGFPVGNITFRSIISSGYSLPKPADVTQQILRIGKVSDGMISFLIDGKYGFTSSDASFTIPPKYKQVGKEFSNGVAYVTEDKFEMKIDKKGKVLGFSERANMTFDEMVAMKKANPNFMKDLEKIALGYAKQSNRTFDELVKIEKEFSGITSQIGLLKTEKYRKDFQQVQNIRQKALAAANSNRIDNSGASTVNDFIKIYGSKYNFDPDGKLSVARELMNYYTVCDALGIKGKSQYWGHRGGKPYFDNSGDHQMSSLSNAQKICSQGGNSDFKNFYAYAKTSIDSKYNQISSTLNQNRRDYQAAIRSYEYEQRRIAESKCKLCGGSGIETCDNCDGSGVDYETDGFLYVEFECEVCDGRGFYRCSRCNGTGHE